MTEQTKEKMKLYVGVPSCRDWKAGFGTSMIALTSMLTTMTNTGEIEDLAIHAQVSSLLSLGREILLTRAIDEGFTHILFIDDDTLFTNETVKSLISRDLDYVAVNFCRKQIPLSFCAVGLDGKQIDSTGKTGIEECMHVGLGMVLIKLSCLKEFPAPRFSVLWWEEAKTYMGEDTFFCHGLSERGVKFY